MAEKHEHIVSPSSYVAVLITLLVLLVLTVAVAFIDLDRRFGHPYLNLAVALFIAVTKAFLIMLIFMHVKYSSQLVWAFAGAAFVWLGILMVLSLSDYLSRNYPEGSPRSRPLGGTPEIQRPPPLPDAVVPGASALPVRRPLPDSLRVRFENLDGWMYLPPCRLAAS